MLPHSDSNPLDSSVTPVEPQASSPSRLSTNNQEIFEIDNSSASQQTLNGSAQSEMSLKQGLLSKQPNLDFKLKLQSPQKISLRMILLSCAIIILGMILDNHWIIIAGMIVSVLIVLRVLLSSMQQILIKIATTQVSAQLGAVLSLFLVVLGYLHLTGSLAAFLRIYQQPNWDAIGAIGEGIIGAFGQILIALIALWVAWRQYVIEKELTTQQNRITQQQTIDTYFQGISDLVIDEEGLLEDWPQERAIAEGRTAALLGSVDNHGKAKIIRFLSHSGLLTPLRRDRHLGRAILDGAGGYAEDRQEGIRVINLRGMLAGADLSATDLRYTDLSDANMLAANLSSTDLTRSNLSRTVLSYTNFREADLEKVCLFYGTVENTSPRSLNTRPNFQTGAHTGAVIENADFTGARDLSPEQRYYCCAWGGSKTRLTVPGGCEGIPNKLGR